jgi:hypothetical protein
MKKREKKDQKSRQATGIKSQGKMASIKVVTFGSVGIFTVPNKLGSDAEKLFDHGLFKDEHSKRNIGMKKRVKV